MVDKLKDLDSKAICSIIESCATHGVTSLKLGDFFIEFSPKAKPESLPEVLTSETHSTNPEAAISDQQHKENTKELLEREEISLRDQEIAEMQITDPLGAEQMLLNGELEDADSDGSDSDDE